MRAGSLVTTLLLLASAVDAQEQACRREVDGTVSCTADGFKKLTDAVLTARADSRYCVDALDDSKARLASCRQSLDSCASAECPAVEPRPIMRQLSGLGLGIAAAVTATLAFCLPIDNTLRAAVAGASITAIAGSAILVAW